MLIRGESGAGKSRLCAQLIDRGGWLLADDAVRIERRGALLVARCPPPIHGHLELRGLGLAVVPALSCLPIDLVVILTRSDTIERLPQPAATDILGVALPLIYAASDEISRAGCYVSASLARLIREVP